MKSKADWQLAHDLHMRDATPAELQEWIGKIQADARVDIAGRLVWLLARLALKQMGRQERPKVGDTVVEVTHLMGLAKRQIGLLAAVGELITIEGEDPTWGTSYTIRTLEGTEQRWENASVVTIDSPRG